MLPVADNRQQDIGLTVGDENPALHVQGNAEDLRILFGNLLDNAVRYTLASGTIDIRLTNNGARAVVAVEDTGPGIAKAEIGHVFERFYRAGEADTEGSGLGLAIASRIAGLHGAQLALEKPAQRDQRRRWLDSAGDIRRRKLILNYSGAMLARNHSMSSSSGTVPPATPRMVITLSPGQEVNSYPFSMRKVSATTRAVRLLPSTNP